MSESLSKIVGRKVLLKPEQHQRTGSFKIRGAYNLVSRVAREAGTNPDGVVGSGVEVVAGSAGNHAQGVALAATLCGLRSTIFMPRAAPLPKVEATKGYGAAIKLQGDVVDEAIQAAKEYAERTGAVYIPPFDHPVVVAGQGTIGLEIAEEAPDAEVVLVPTGGGGLLAGVGAALSYARPQVAVIGVEAARAAALRASLDAGYPVTISSASTLADGIAVRAPSEYTFAEVSRYASDVVTVTEEEISQALVLLLERSKMVVEPAGAAGLAALLAGNVPGDGPVVVVLSGGNVDPLLLMKLIDRGMSAAGRYLMVRVLLSDRPGALAALTKAVADLAINVLEVEHHRSGLALRVDEVQVLLTLETRGHRHGMEIMAQLGEAGFKVEPLQ